MFQKKRKIILSLLFIGLLSACSNNTPIEEEETPIIEEPVETVNRMDQEYRISELSVPEVLKPSESYVLQQGAVDEYTAYFQLLDKKARGLYPTKALYAYHSDTQKAEEIKSYQDNEEIRVIDFRFIEDDLYEIQVKQLEDKVECNVVLNGDVIQTNYISDPFNAPMFTSVGGKLQYLIGNITNDQTTLSLYELNHRNVTKLYTEELSVVNNETQTGVRIDSGTVSQNSKYLLSFAINIDGEEYLYVYDGKEINKALINGKVYRSIPLKDQIFIILENEVEGKRTLEYCIYNHKSKTVSEIEGDVPVINQAVHLTNNEFLYTTDQRETAIATVEDGKLIYKLVSGIPDAIKFYGNLSDNQSFVFLEQIDGDHTGFNDNIHFYTINWK